MMELSKAHKYFELAEYQANLFSKDPSRKVACILLAPDSNQILSTGFNGICRKLRETPERWARPMKYSYVVHAETNAIANAARSGIKVENSICITTLFPCTSCCKCLIQSGISTVITKQPDFENDRWGDDFKISKNMFEEAKVNLVYLP